MLKNRKRIFLLCLISGLLIICTTYIYVGAVSKLLEIDFLDVGQGDSSLIKLPNNKLILIDGGPDNLVLRRLGENLPFYRRRIDLVILSHFHDDHLIGLIEIIKRYQIGSIIYNPDIKDSDLLNKFLLLAREKKIKLISLERSVKINYSPDCVLNILNPSSLDIKADDNNSLVSHLSCRGLTALFSGDNNFTVENLLLKTGGDWTAEIFKASHHGSKTANSEIFLEAIKASSFIISVGKLNRFGHPSQEVLERAQSLDLKIQRTDWDGTIKIYGSQ